MPESRYPLGALEGLGLGRCPLCKSPHGGAAGLLLCRRRFCLLFTLPPARAGLCRIGSNSGREMSLLALSKSDLAAPGGSNNELTLMRKAPAGFCTQPNVKAWPHHCRQQAYREGSSLKTPVHSLSSLHRHLLGIAWKHTIRK